MTYPTSDGGARLALDINNTYYGLKFKPLGYTASVIRSFIMHTTTDWTIVSGGSTLITADSGATWTAATADAVAMTGACVRCEGTRTSAICFDHNANDGYITADSGDNWAQMTVPPAAVTKCFDVSFPTSAVAVCACDLGAAARGIFRSTDGGDNWAICTTGPAADVYQISMYDATYGFAVDSAGNIWYTINAGVDWTDTTFGTGTEEESLLVAISATEYLYLNRPAESTATAISLSYGTNVAAPTTKLSIGNGILICTNFVVSDTGNIYFGTIIENDDGGVTRTNSVATIYRSTDSGATWNISESYNLQHEANPYGGTYFPRGMLQEHTGLIIMNGMGTNYLRLNEVYSGAV